MPLIVSQIITGTGCSKEEIVSEALKKLSLKMKNVKKAEVHKTSLDARDNSRIRLVSSVWLELSSSGEEKRLADRYGFCTFAEAAETNAVPQKRGTEPLRGRVVVAGFGPAGMFAALTLAEYGYRPIVLERGAEIDERVAAVEGFWKGGSFSE